MSHNDNGSPTNSEHSKKRATLTVDTLEARILLSATWTDADTDNPLEGPTVHNDVFLGDAKVDLVHALQGNDQLFGDAGQDVLSGGEGRDYLRGGADDDRLEGGADDDTLVGDQGRDSLLRGEGNGRLYGGDDNDLLDGGAGNDRLDGGVGDDQLSGGEGNDDLRGGFGNDVLDGGTGTDRFYGQDGDDTILAGDGNDRIDGGNGNDTIHAGAGNNRIVGGAGNDVIHSGAGNDVINAGAGDDTINYHGGRDRIDLRGGGQDMVVIHNGNDGDVVSIVRGTSDTTIDLTAYGEDQVTVDGRWVAVETDGGDSFRVQISGQEQILTSVAPPVAVYAGVDLDIAEGEAVQLNAQASQFEPGFQFDGATVESYGGYQDASGTADVTDDGLTLNLEGNTWKQVEFPYTITEDTILEFDFRSLAQADIHGIGFDVDNEVTLLGSDTANAQFVAPHLEQHTELVIQVTANDGQHASTDLVTVVVADLVSGPVAGEDALSVLEDHEGVTVNVLANDYDADADSFALTTFTQAEHGSVVYEGDGQFRYIPTADYDGADLFEYTIVDSDGLQATGTVNVEVEAVNDAPVAQIDALQLQEDADRTVINVLDNDSDVDGDSLNVVSFTQPEHGEVAYRGDGTFEYRPHENYAGSDRFTYNIDDGQGGQTTAHVDVNVDGVADAPELFVSSAKGFAHSQIALDIRSALVDTDGSESLQIFVEGLPEDAQLSAGERLADGRWLLAEDELEGLTVSSANVGEHSVSIIAKAIDSNGHEAVVSQVVNLMVVTPPVVEAEFNWTDDFLQELNPDDEGEGLGASLRSLEQAEELVQVGLDDSGEAIEGIPILRDIVHLGDAPRYEPFEPGDFAFSDPLSDLVDRDSTDREVEEIRQSVYVPSQDGQMNPGESDGDEARPQKAAGGLAALWGLLRGFAGTRDKQNDNASGTSRRKLH